MSPCLFKRKGTFISLSSLARADDAKIVRSRDAQCNLRNRLLFCNLRNLFSFAHDRRRRQSRDKKKNSGVENGTFAPIATAHLYCARYSLVKRVLRHFQARAPSRKLSESGADDLCVNLVCEYFCWMLGEPHFLGRSLLFLILFIILKK